MRGRAVPVVAEVVVPDRLVIGGVLAVALTLAACATRPRTEVAAAPASSLRFHRDSLNMISCAERVAAPYGFDRGLRRNRLVRRVDRHTETIFVWPYTKGDTLHPGAFFGASNASGGWAAVQQINQDCAVAAN